MLRVTTGKLKVVGQLASGSQGSIARDGSWVATATSTSVTISRGNGGASATLATTTGYSHIQFSPDARRLFLFGYLGRIEVIDVESAKIIATYGLRSDSCVGFRPDGRYKMWGDPGGHFGHSIRLCRFQPGEVPALDAMLRLPDDEALI